MARGDEPLTPPRSSDYEALLAFWFGRARASGSDPRARLGYVALRGSAMRVQIHYCVR